MKHMFDLSGKVAAVIGGASGIGEAVTIGAAQLGAKTVCLDIKEEDAARVSARACEGGCQCEPGAIDIRDSAAVQASFDGIAQKHGSLDIVICTPSINVRKKILDYQDDELARVLDLNIKGNFNVLRAAGRIVWRSGCVGEIRLERALIRAQGFLHFARFLIGPGEVQHRERIERGQLERALIRRVARIVVHPAVAAGKHHLITARQRQKVLKAQRSAVLGCIRERRVGRDAEPLPRVAQDALSFERSGCLGQPRRQAVEMKAGQTFAIAGLVQERTESRNRGLPYLSDVPVLGVPFRRTRNVGSTRGCDRWTSSPW